MSEQNTTALSENTAVYPANLPLYRVLEDLRAYNDLMEVGEKAPEQAPENESQE